VKLSQPQATAIRTTPNIQDARITARTNTLTSLVRLGLADWRYRPSVIPGNRMVRIAILTPAGHNERTALVATEAEPVQHQAAEETGEREDAAYRKLNAFAHTSPAAPQQAPTDPRATVCGHPTDRPYFGKDRLYRCEPCHQATTAGRCDRCGTHAPRRIEAYKQNVCSPCLHGDHEARVSATAARTPVTIGKGKGNPWFATPLAFGGAFPPAPTTQEPTAPEVHDIQQGPGNTFVCACGYSDPDGMTNHFMINIPAETVEMSTVWQISGRGTLVYVDAGDTEALAWAAAQAAGVDRDYYHYARHLTMIQLDELTAPTTA
jgi:hypothetical protein